MSEITQRLKTAIADRYMIERELGQGGMATVYLALDVRHDRKVALKVLRPELAAVIGAERFLAEIKTTANLQHPHILALFDSGEADGFVYYVMPYVEGESLRDRLMREHQLPVDEAVRITRETADALEYAHRQGIVHRDIKPENILLHGGHAMVADFGIALAVSRSEGSTRLTDTGLSLGTPHYMSPEQAMGEREITPRADVYALGCVLYEMLTAEPPFTGATAQAIIARVMTEQPRRLAIQRHTVPPHVEAAVLKAIEKLPADRHVTAAAFAQALEDASYRAPVPAGVADAPGEAGARWARPHRYPLLLAGLGGVAIGVLLLTLLRPGPEPARVTRYGLALPSTQAPDAGFRVIPSPDGSRIAYVGPAPEGDQGSQVWIKERDEYEARPLAGTDGVYNFTFSPDGAWLAFVMGLQLRKIPIVGGAAITLADTVSANPGLAWLDDDTIVFVRLGGTTLQRVPAEGGLVTDVLADSATLYLPTPLPEGRGILFTRCPGSCGVHALDFRSGAIRQVAPGALLGWFVRTGFVVYIQPTGAVFAMPLDLRSLEPTGPAVPVLDNVLVVNEAFPMMAVTTSGTLVMRAGSPVSWLERHEMVWVDRGGRATPVDPDWTFRLTVFGGNIGWALSPDGRRLAIGLATEGGDDIWVKQLPRGPVSRVSFDSTSEYRPRWTPDGRSVVFGAVRPGAGTGGLFVRRADGTGADSAIWRAPTGIFEGTFSADGRWVLLRIGGTIRQRGGRDIVGMRTAVDTAPVPVVATPYDEEAIALSPNGRWLAYESNETGRTEVFLRPFPDTDSGKWQVSNGGGYAPLWAKDGSELFYVGPGRDMMAVVVGSGSERPLLGERRVLFRLSPDLHFTFQEFYTPHDVAPDGRFIMARRVTSGSSIDAPLIVVENWLEELTTRVRR